jgi:hypothetical protein
VHATLPAKLTRKWFFMVRIIIFSAIGLLFTGNVLAGPDNVVFPKDYRDAFELVAVRDHHLGGNSIAVIYGNKVALDSVKRGGPLDSGSVFLMEVWRAKMNGNELARDDKGRLVRDTMGNINMMEKRTGWGVGYPPEWRNGEWEFATFTADGTPRTGNLQGCFECHQPLGDAGYDFAYVVGDLRQ